MELDNFKSMLNHANIDYEESKTKHHIQIQVQNSPGIGYAGFVSMWIFTHEGILTKVGHYE